jgi:hypothetical protein
MRKRGVRIPGGLEGRFTVGEMLRFTSRRQPSQPMIDGDWFFPSAYLADSCEVNVSDTTSHDGSVIG